MSDRGKPPGVPLGKEELQTLAALAASTMDRSELLLADYFQGRIKLSSPLLSRICELYASGTIFAEYIENNFDIEHFPEGGTLNVPPKHVKAMARIVMSISECNVYLASNNINMNKNSDV